MSKAPNIATNLKAIPSGYVLGRTEAGPGAPHLVPIKALAQKLVQSGGVAGPGAFGNANQPVLEFLGFSAQGPFSSHLQLSLAMVPALNGPSHGVRFPSVRAPGRDKAVCQFAPVADTSFVLTADRAAYLANGSGALATVTFLAHQKVGSIVWNSSHSAVVGEVLFVVFPTAPDTALAEVQCLFCGDPT